MSATPIEDVLTPEIKRLRMLHQAIGAQLRHVENLQSMANQDVIAPTQPLRPSTPRKNSPQLANDAIAATLQGNPAIGMTWASSCKHSVNGNSDTPLH